MIGLLKPLIAALVSVAAIVALLALVGQAPGDTLTTLYQGSMGDPYAISETIGKAIPLLLTALAVVIAFRAGVWNIGGEGQFILGGIAALLAARVSGSAAVAIVAGGAAGAIWALLPALMRLLRNAPEVLTTILLNFVAIHLLGWVVNGPLQEKGAAYPQSEMVPAASELPTFGQTSLSSGVFIALLLAALLYLILFRTPAGLRLRAVGLNRKAAEYAGVSAPPRIVCAMLASGAFAGIAGAIELLGVTHRLYERFASGYGYSGITVALLAQTHPLGSILSALFLAAVRTGCGELQRSSGISSAVATLTEGIVIALLVLFGAARLRENER